MFCYHGTATDTKGNSLVGYFVECLASGVVQSIYADNSGTPIVSVSGVANRAKTDGRGNFNFYVADGTYDLKYYDDNGEYQFTESGFTMVDGATLLAAASAAINVKTFGAVGDGVTNDSAAFTAAIAYLKSTAVNDDVYYKGSRKLFVPAGEYLMGTTTLDITHTLIIEGESSMNGYSSRLVWTGDCDGIRIQAYNTNGATAVDGSPYHYSGSYTIVRNLGLAGPYANNSNFTGNTEGDYHGIRCRTNYIIEDCLIDGFAGDGIYSKASAGAGAPDEGNSNCSFISRVKVTNVRNGVYLDGADANACTLTGVIGVYCRQFTVYDSSFLGNTHIGHHSANAGLVRGVAASVVSIGGSRYFVKQGQATGASTNAPKSSTVTITIATPGVVTWNAHGLGDGNTVTFSTTGALPTGLTAATKYYVVNSTTNTFQVSATSGGAAINTTGSQSGVHTSAAGVDNTYWAYLQAGAVDTSLNIQAWVNAISVREGGCYNADSANGYNTFIGCYSEGGEGGPQAISPTMFVGGLFGSREPIGGCNYFAGGKINAPNAAILGQTRMANAVAATVNISVTHNSGAFASSTGARHGFAQGYEGDGTTPAYAGSIYGYHSTSNQSTAEGILAFATRTAGGAGAQGDRMFLDGPNATLRPATDNVLDVGTTALRWKQLWSYIADAKTEYRVNGTKVVGTRKTGWTVATGTATRTAFDTTTVTLPQLAERVKALIDDLHGTAGHGIIGT
jgi:hypothetical protein